MGEIIEWYVPKKHKSKLLQFPAKQEPKVERIDGILITDKRRISDNPEI